MCEISCALTEKYSMCVLSVRVFMCSFVCGLAHSRVCMCACVCYCENACVSDCVRVCLCAYAVTQVFLCAYACE